MSSICVIGGSRYVGRTLVRRLLDAGHQVAVVNRGSVPQHPGVEHLVADRDDERALTAAVHGRSFDVVVDQVCYTPVQARTAARVLGGRTGRYVMTSTIEVYDPATFPVPHRHPEGPVPEDAVDPGGWAVDPGLPWHDEAYVEAHYAEGKRQAEAVLVREAGCDVAIVRSAHVLGGGAQEFTGRLAHYVDRIGRGEPVEVHPDPLPTVFIHHEELAALLHRVATASDLTGPLNACSHGMLDVRGLCEVVGSVLGRPPVHRTVAAGGAASPFSVDRHYAMGNARASGLGFTLSDVADWLPAAVAEIAPAPV